MQRQFIANLQARDQVDEIYRVVDKQVRSNRQGNDYLLLQLLDRTGQISGLRWNAGQSLYETFQRAIFCGCWVPRSCTMGCCRSSFRILSLSLPKDQPHRF